MESEHENGAGSDDQETDELLEASSNTSQVRATGCADATPASGNTARWTSPRVDPVAGRDLQAVRDPGKAEVAGKRGVQDRRSCGPDWDGWRRR